MKLKTWLSMDSPKRKNKPGEDPQEKVGLMGWSLLDTDQVDDVLESDTCEETHLYVLVHGFNSKADHLKYLADHLRNRLGPSALVHAAKCNEARIANPFMHPTHDGIDTGGERLAAEVREVVKRHPALKFISFIGNSMGGLFARYALGLLFDSNTGLVAGLMPVTFMTTATPHLGVRGLIPKAMQHMLNGGPVSGYGGRSLKQLLLRDAGTAPSAPASPTPHSAPASPTPHSAPASPTPHSPTPHSPTRAYDLHRAATVEAARRCEEHEQEEEAEEGRQGEEAELVWGALLDETAWIDPRSESPVAGGGAGAEAEERGVGARGGGEGGGQAGRGAAGASAPPLPPHPPPAPAAGRGGGSVGEGAAAETGTGGGGGMGGGGVGEEGGGPPASPTTPKPASLWQALGFATLRREQSAPAAVAAEGGREGEGKGGRGQRGSFSSPPPSPSPLVPAPAPPRPPSLPPSPEAVWGCGGGQGRTGRGGGLLGLLASSRRRSSRAPSSPTPASDARSEDGGEGREDGGGERGWLLLEMTRGGAGLPFMAALSAFRARVLYGNTCNDLLVRYETACISVSNLPGWQAAPAPHPRFPHIIADDLGEVSGVYPAGADQAAAFFVNDPRQQQLQEMTLNLSRLPWRRVSVRFERTVKIGHQRKALPGFLSGLGLDAHNRLPVVRPLIDGDGFDTVNHLCDILMDHAKLATHHH